MNNSAILTPFRDPTDIWIRNQMEDDFQTQRLTLHSIIDWNVKMFKLNNDNQLIEKNISA